MLKRIGILIAFMAVIVIAAIPLTLSGQQLKEQYFAEADQMMAAAKEAHADLLAPKSFGKALEHYQKADRKFEKEESIDDIKKEIKQSVEYLQKAMEAAKIAEVTLTSTIQARRDALEAAAPEYSGSQWAEADKKFLEAAAELETGDVKDAQKKGGAAEALYRDAELSAIKSHLFNDTRLLQEQAGKNKVDKYAPKTLARSLALLKEAETALEQNRYDTDRPRTLAREAMYEAKHAIHIADIISNMEKRKVSDEDLILNSEVPLRRIASSIGVTALFDEGYEKPTALVLEHIEAGQTAAEKSSQEIADQNQHVADLEEHIATLETKLGGAKEEQAALNERISAQEEVKKKFGQVETMFDRSEARVLREGNTVIIRLIGMNFEVGQSTIRPEHFGLLSKVQEAIMVFPKSDVRVEGHTDSYGTDEANLTLSEERAEAVRLYLTANMGSGAPKITSIGYGETRPIANNETSEGRAANRRIDIVIVPQM